MMFYVFDDLVVEVGQGFIVYFVIVDNGGIIDLVLDRVMIYILVNDKVEGVVVVDLLI